MPHGHHANGNGTCVHQDGGSAGSGPLPAELALAGIVLVIVAGLFRNCYSPRLRRWGGMPVFGSLAPRFSAWLDLSRSEFLACVAVFTTSGLPVLLSGLYGGYFACAKLVGTTATIALAVCVVPATRTTLWVRVFGVSFDRAIMFHRWLCWWAVAACWAHLLLYLLRSGTCILDNSVAESPPLNGAISTWIFTALSIMSLNFFRRRMFEVFRVAHWLFVPAFILGIMHTGSVAAYGALPAILYAIDRLMRWFRSHQEWEAVTVAATGANIVHLTVKPAAGSTHRLAFEAGQYCFIRVPVISEFEWHPISVCSAPNHSAATLSFAIKSMGANTWSGRLLALAEAGSSTTAPPLAVRVDGAFGHLAHAATAAKHVVLVGGGIGATPLIAILEQLMRVGASTVCEVVTVVWAARDVAEFKWCQSLLLRAHVCAHPRVILQLHVTGKHSDNHTDSFPVPTQPGRPDIATVLKHVALAGSTTGSASGHGVTRVNLDQPTESGQGHAAGMSVGDEEASNGLRRIDVRVSATAAANDMPGTKSEPRPAMLSPSSSVAASAAVASLPTASSASTPPYATEPAASTMFLPFLNGPPADKEDIIVLASGPGPLVAQTQRLCSAMGLPFHHESFLF